MSAYRITTSWLTVLLLCFASYAAQSFAQDGSSIHTNNVVTIEIKDFKFVPAVITIEPGQRVVWINSDDEPHAVMAADKLFRSVSLDTGERYTRTFAAGGEFNYYCSFHPHMTGRVVVRQSAQGS
jgi:plastocyanin